MDKVTIGIPRALLYYKYGELWKNFFNELGFNVLCSPQTNSNILERGKKHTIDESCLALKIYMGHVHYLIDKADYILVPRIICLNKKEKLCTNFSALYDIVNNTYDVNIIHYNIDKEKGINEKRAFFAMGKQLGKCRKEVRHAYYKAKRISERNKYYRYIKQQHLLVYKKCRDKVLLVGHPYNVYDALVGNPIIKLLKQMNVDIVFADIFDKKENKDKYKQISKRLYWTYNKELLGSIVNYQDKVDGIILLTVFPCGPDSLTNEMCIHKIKIPIINIIVDELTGEAGMQTRIESFIDIIREKKRMMNDEH